MKNEGETMARLWQCKKEKTIQCSICLYATGNIKNPPSKSMLRTVASITLQYTWQVKTTSQALWKMSGLISEDEGLTTQDCHIMLINAILKQEDEVIQDLL